MSELNVNKITEYTSGNGVEFQGYKETDVAVTSTSGVIAIDLANGNTGSITLSENITDIDFTNVPTNGTSSFTLKVTQDGTGTRTMAINAITVNGGGNVTGLTPGAAGLTLSTGAADIDLVSFLFFDAGTPLINSLLDFSQEVHMPLGATRFGFQVGETGVEVQYLVVAGGGGASTASSSGNRPGGGAGAGGYRNSYASETSGGNSATETPLTLDLSTNYTVTVGSGGTGGSGNYLRSGTKGSDSVFSTITSEGGGAVVTSDNSAEDGGSGGGGMHLNGAGGDGITGQGHDGGDTNNATSQTGGGGGGAGSAGGNNVHFQSGTSNNGSGLASSITGSSVTRAVGGSAGQQGTTSGVNAAANTGSGGGGSSSNGSSGNGGSGIVILRYSNTYTITVGSGLTHGSEQTDGDDKYIVFTAGTDTVSFS